MTNKPNDGSNDKSHARPKKDAFLVKPIILVAVLFLMETVFVYIDSSFIFIFFIDLSVLIIIVAFLFVGIKHIVHGYYKSALSLILIIPILILSFGLPGGLLSFVVASKNKIHFVNPLDVAYYIKFTLHEKQYLEAIKLIQPDDKGFRFGKFNWSIGSSGEGTELIYDERDELELPEASRSNVWWEKVGGREGYFSCLSGSYKIKSHFYIVKIDCG